MELLLLLAIRRLSTIVSKPLRVSTRRTEDKFTAAFVPSAEARAVTVSLGTQETPVMPKALLLTASTKRVRSQIAGQRLDRRCRWRPKYPQPPRCPQRRPGCQPALFSWAGGWCLRTCKPSAGNVTRMHCWEHFGLPRMRKGEVKHDETHC